MLLQATPHFWLDTVVVLHLERSLVISDLRQLLIFVELALDFGALTYATVGSSIHGCLLLVIRVVFFLVHLVKVVLHSGRMVFLQQLLQRNELVRHGSGVTNLSLISLLAIGLRLDEGVVVLELELALRGHLSQVAFLGLLVEQLEALFVLLDTVNKLLKVFPLLLDLVDL